MHFKEYIQNLSRFQLFQLYTIITIVFYFGYILLFLDKQNSVMDSNPNISNIKNNIKTIRSQINPPNIIDVLKDIEIEAKKYKELKLLDFNIQKNSIGIKGYSTLNSLLNYINYCENYSPSSRIDSLFIKPSKKDMFDFSINIKFVKKYRQTQTLKEQNLIKTQIAKLAKSKDKADIKLQAIVNDQIVINNRFYLIGDSVNGYKIDKVSKNMVYLKKDNSTKILYLQKDINNEN